MDAICEEKAVRTLSFSITGEFVTKTAREWFWLEHKPWATVEEFLLSCMLGTSHTDDELKMLACNVVFGRAKFIGNTRDESYRLVDDDQDLAILNVEQMSRHMKSTEADLKELQKQYLDLIERIEDLGYERLLRPWPEPPMCSAPVSPALDSYMKQAHIEEKFEDNYGWLEPDGTFHPAEFAEHQAWAEEAIGKRGWFSEYDAWGNGQHPIHSEFKARVGLGAYGDFLVYEKGWVLLHNPHRGTAMVQNDPRRNLTKAQREFLFSYYAVRGLDDQAKKYLEDE